MIALWIAYAIAVAGLMGLAAWAVERVLRAWGRPTRHVWALALLASLALPAAVATLRSFEAPTPLGEMEAVAGEVSPLAPRVGPVAYEGAPTNPILDRAIDLFGPVAPRLALLDRPLGSAWAVASGCALLLLLLGLRAMARRRAGWRRQIVESRPVLVAPDFGPAVVGVRHPEIVVPEWALSLERRLLQLVLLHEDQHRSAGDTVLLTVGVLAVAAAPWNLFLWWQLRRLRLAVEVDCDRRVLGRGVSRVAYGRLLLEVGRRQPRSGLAVAALAEPRSSLERRIRMITTRGSNRSVLRAALALTFAALLVVVACETPMPMEVEQALDEAGMTRGDLVTSDGPGSYRLRSDVLVFVDGTEVSDLDALPEIGSEQIERIEVVKGEAAVELMGARARGGMIRITTKEAQFYPGSIERLEAEGDGSTEAHMSVRGEVRSILRARDVTATARFDAAEHPLFIVDGVITDLTPEEARALDIERVEVVRGEAARTAAGERGADGVILITTRQSDEPPRRLQEVVAAPTVDAVEETFGPGASPIFFVDGARTDRPFSELRALDIERVEVVMGEDAVARLGPEAADGIVYITTRDGGG